MQDSGHLFQQMYKLPYNWFDGKKLVGVRVKDVIAEGRAPFTLAEIFGPGRWNKQSEAGEGGPGHWAINSDGALTGWKTDDGPTILWYTQPIQGPHMIEFQASTVSPSAQDINCLWNGSGDWSIRDPSTASIGGIGGWVPKIYWGIEARDGTWVHTQGGKLTADRRYNLVAGQLTVETDKKPVILDFLRVDGKLIAHVQSPRGGYPNVEPRNESQVALTTWQSHINVYSFRISQIEPWWE